MIWAPAIAFYVCGVLAYAIFNARSLPPSILNVAAQDHVFASSVALSTIGTAVIWPIALLVVGYFAIKARLEQRRVKAPFFRMLQRGETVQAALDKMGGVDDSDLPELPLPPPCSGCGDEIDFLGHGHGNLNRMIQVNDEQADPTAVDIEQFVLCSECFERAAYGMTPCEAAPLVARLTPGVISVDPDEDTP